MAVYEISASRAPARPDDIVLLYCSFTGTRLRILVPPNSIATTLEDLEARQERQEAELAKKRRKTLDDFQSYIPKYIRYDDLPPALCYGDIDLFVIYKWQRDLYDKCDNALSSLRTSIQSSVSRSCLHYTFGTSDAREMLIQLQKRLQPTDQLRELDLSAKYQKLKKAPKAQDLDTWLRNWEKVYHECNKINLPDVQGIRAVRDFLRAVPKCHVVCSQSAFFAKACHSDFEGPSLSRP
jgi:hypothetical protein